MALFENLLPLAPEEATKSILALNEHTARYGMTLTPGEARQLVAAAQRSLMDTGRIDFGGGIFDKCIRLFCDSPYIQRDHYAETLAALVEAFYYYKNETRDRVSDDELLQYMKRAFDGRCHGSVELLTGRELFRFARDGGISELDAEAQAEGEDE